jgi:hypothetical protein
MHMMKLFRPALVASLVIVLSGAPAAAGDLLAGATAAAQAAATPSPLKTNTALKLTGAAVFVGGMTTGLVAFLNNKNGKYPEFGEADAVNKTLGAAGILAAFGGGLLIYMGSRAPRAPQLSIAPGRVTVGKALSW